jgi:flagellar biosynthesis/type III secretory pathway protein FliH
LPKYSETTSEIKVKPMPIQVDIRKTFLYKWGEEEGEKRGFEKGKQEGLKEGLKEGLREGLKKAILLDAEAKFGSSKARKIKKLLDKINEINRLEKIKREIIKAKTWDDFVRSIKNSNSKNKI